MIRYYLPALLAITSLSYASSGVIEPPQESLVQQHDAQQITQSQHANVAQVVHAEARHSEAHHSELGRNKKANHKANHNCKDGACLKTKQQSHSNEVLSHFIETDDMSGYACYTYKYNTPQDRSQLLGVLKDPYAPIIREYGSESSDDNRKVHNKKKHKKMHKKSQKRAPAARYDLGKHKDATNVDPAMTIVEPSLEKAPIEDVQHSAIKSTVTAKDAGVASLPVEIVSSMPSATAEIPANITSSAEDAASHHAVALQSSQADVAASAAPAPIQVVEKSVMIDFSDLEVSISDGDISKIKALAQEMLINPNFVAKITSNCFDKNGNHAESRRVALQRAIKVRKILIDVGVNPNSVSVYAAEDLELKSNNLSITLKDETPKSQVK